jgi:hypothetical protein
MTPVWLFALIVTGAPNPHLTAAEDHVAQVRYSEAEKSLGIARAQPKNPRETLLRILELQGIVAATLNQAPKARGYFQHMLSLDPERKLPEGLPPRVRTPFYEAKGMVSEATPMVFTATPESTPEGLVLQAKLSADPMTLARKVRFHLKPQNGSWAVTDKPLTAGAASLTAGPGRFEWWAELLGEQDATLFTAGSEGKPFADGASLEPVAVAPPTDVPVIVTPQASSSRVHPAAWVCFAGAGATAIGGVVAGVMSRGNNGRVDNAPKDADGFVTGLTQRQAAGLREQARTQAVAANVLFGAAAALAGTGAVIWIFSGSDKVALVPGPGGVVVVGALP